MFQKSIIPATLIPLFFLSPALAQDWTYIPPGALATELTGGYGAVASTDDGSVYNDGSGDYSYAVVLDSGSSGFLMSLTVQQAFAVPLQDGQSYVETGIGGSETENVTVPLVAYYSPASNSNPDNISTMTAYGTYTFESRQDDPLQDFIYFDVIGTPIIQQKVMVVTPSQSYNLVQDTLGFLTAQTTLQSTRPVLPTTGTYHIPITWTNFITGTTVPTEGLNPVVKGVTARGPNGVSVAHDWLLDTGSQFTIISPDYASALGVNLDNPINEIEGLGVGGSTVTFDEFQLAEIDLPLSTGDRLVFQNPYVWVPSGASLPADLTGILGENLFMQSADSIDPETGLPVGSHAALFAQWYLDGPGSELVLYDPNSSYGAIPPVWTGTASNTWSVLTADKNWAGGTPWTNNANRNSPSNAIFNLATPAYISVNGLIDVGSITFSTGGWTLAAGAGLLAFGGTGTMNIASTGSNTITAVIADGASFGAGGGVTALAVSGPGTLILGGPNSYTGGTILSAGILLVNNISGSGTGSGNVVINGGTLGGSGSIAGTVLPGSGAYRIHPGEGLAATDSATLTLGALSTNSSTTLAFNLITPGVSSVNDVIHVTSHGGLALNGGHLEIASSSAGAPSLGYYKAIQYSGTIQGPGISSITLPTVVDNIVYFLDTSHDPGYIDIHRGFLGDANDDGIVNAIDLGILATNYNSTTAKWSQGDYNGDGIVNAIDLGILATNYNAVVGAGSFEAALDGYPTLVAAYDASEVPEPASLALLGLGAVSLLARRRRCA